MRAGKNSIPHLILGIFLLLPLCARAQKPAITNVRYERDGNFFIITYDLKGPARPLNRKIKVALSSDGGRSYTIVPRAVYGSVGEGVIPGVNKTIVWIMAKDYPGGIPSSNLRARVTIKGGGFGRFLAGVTIVGGGAAAYYYYVYLPGKEATFPLPPDRP